MDENPPINVTATDEKYFTVDGIEFKVGNWVKIFKNLDRIHADDITRVDIIKNGVVFLTSWNSIYGCRSKLIELKKESFKNSTYEKATQKEVCMHVHAVINKAIPYIIQEINLKQNELVEDIKTRFDDLKKLFDDPYCKDEHGKCLLSQECQQNFHTLEGLITNSEKHKQIL